MFFSSPSISSNTGGVYLNTIIERIIEKNMASLSRGSTAVSAVDVNPTVTVHSIDDAGEEDLGYFLGAKGTTAASL